MQDNTVSTKLSFSYVKHDDCVIILLKPVPPAKGIEGTVGVVHTY